MTKLIDLVGQRFGRLTVDAFCGPAPSRHLTWKCPCDCGNVVIVRGANLRSGATRSCGCLAREMPRQGGGRRPIHGMSRTPEYSRWLAIKQRCFNPRNPNYKWYGALNVGMYADWVTSFTSFFADTGMCPPGCSIDRTNPSGDYSPDNIRWATATEQARNRRPPRKRAPAPPPSSREDDPPF